MNLIRLVLFGIACYVAWRLWKNWQAQQQIGRRPGPETGFEPMVRCRRCGVHLPASAVSSAGLCGKCSG